MEWGVAQLDKYDQRSCLLATCNFLSRDSRRCMSGVILPVPVYNHVPVCENDRHGSLRLSLETMTKTERKCQTIGDG